MNLKGKTVTLKSASLKKKSRKIKRSKAFSNKGAAGKVSYKLVSVKKARYKKYFKMNSKTGDLTVKKNLKKGSCQVKVRVTAAGNVNYKKTVKNVTFKVKIR